MSVAADGGDALDPEIKRCDWETCLLEEGHDEAAQAAVDVQADVVLGSKLAERDDIVLAPIGEVDGGANELQKLSAHCAHYMVIGNRP